MDKGSKNVFANGTNSIPASDGNYTDAYNRIRRTNILLQKAESFANQSDIAQYIGEAKFSALTATLTCYSFWKCHSSHYTD